MATSTELLVNDVAYALQELTWLETKDLTLRLGVKLNVLDSIETDRSGNDRKTHSIQYWLDNDLEASWGRIISGLREIGKKALAENVATQYCPQARVPVTDSPSSDPSSSATVHTVQPVHPPPQAPVSGVTQSSVNPESAVTDVPLATSPPSISFPPPDSDRVVEVKAAVDHLEQEFLGVTMKFRRAMTKKEDADYEFLEDFRDALLGLPVAKRALHVKFFRDKMEKIIAAEKVRILLAVLSPYWNYSKYDLLQYLITMFGDDTMKTSMHQYCVVIEKYEIKTTIDVFLAAFSANSELSVAFSRMVVKINKPPTECTLHDIRVFREALAVQSSIYLHSIYVDAMATSSVRVTLGFHPSALGWVLAALSPSFLESHQLSDVVVEGKPLVVYETGNLNEQLLEASEAGDVVKVTSLLNSGADVNTVNTGSQTPLDRASWCGHLHTVHLLLQRGAVVDSRSKSGYFALWWAALEGHTEVVQQLVKAGANLDLQDESGRSALYWATWKGHTKIVQQLVKAGANLDLQDKSGRSALYWATWKGHTKIVQQLVKAGANLDLQNKDGIFALYWAAYEGYTEIVQQLVKASANLDLQDKRGDSAVITATVEHQSGALQELVRAGADLNLQNEEGLTALMISARSGRTELTDILLTGDNIDTDIQENTTGWSALFFAAEEGDVATTQSLLTAGANALLKNKDGVTALEVAAASDRDDVHELLSQHIQKLQPKPSPDIPSSNPDVPFSDLDVPSSDQDTATAPTQERRGVSEDVPSSDPDVPSSDQDTTTAPTQERRGVSEYVPSSDPDVPSSDQDTATAPTQERRGVSETLRNLVNRSKQRAREIFHQLDSRLRSADEKSISGVKGQMGEDTQKNRDEDRTITLYVQ